MQEKSLKFLYNSKDKNGRFFSAAETGQTSDARRKTQTSYIRRQNILDLPFVLRFRTIADRAFPIFILYFYSEHIFAFRAGHTVIAFTTGQAQNAFAMRAFFVNVRFSVFPHLFSEPKKLFNAVFY